MSFLDAYSGFLLQHMPLSALSSVAVVLLIGYFGLPFFVWVAVLTGILIGFGAPSGLVLGFVLVSLVFLIQPLRQATVSNLVMGLFKKFKIIPQISQTERTALEAGVVWSEADLFSGKPNFKKLMSEPYPELTAEEKAFMEGPVHQLCEMVNEWKIYRTRDLPDEVMQFIKDNKFLGMIIPKEYGGLGFSHYAHAEVIQTVSSRSIAAGITIMVPNSLGPAELLNHYGTDAQKKKWLQRLAEGKEMPCFGLTEPQAGSDAGSITSEGVLYKNAQGELCIRLNWRKRWITLAAISTVIGLAFRLRDPENLLGKGEDLGITCALIPSDKKGVVLGRRHDPLGIPFYNCPTEGHNVEINAEESIIGGLEGAGKGWGMLMESLGAGRGISIPAQSASGIKNCARVASAHATIRKQFGLSIGKFEGVEEPLARISGMVYYSEAMRRYTLGALNQDIKPPVVTAMMKYNASEWFRKAVNDGMDILGGAAISLGPRNNIAIGYMAAPISITVEGANILTRTLMIFGQGALRAHPYAYKEVSAVENNDLKAFDKAFWGHIGHVVHNQFRALLLFWTRGYLAFGLQGDSHTRRYFRKLNWTSARFAILADIAMGVLGGKLKVKEKITGRFADILSHMYLATAVLRRYEAEGRRKEDLPFVHYSMQYAFSTMQESFIGLFANFEGPLPLKWLFRGPLSWLANLNNLSAPPSDELGHQLCELMQEDSEQRDRLTAGIHYPTNPEDGIGRYELAFKTIKKSEAIEKKIKKAIKKKELPKKRVRDLINLAFEKSIISEEEMKTIRYSEELRWDAIQVDEFSQEEYLNATEAKRTIHNMKDHHFDTTLSKEGKSTAAPSSGPGNASPGFVAKGKA